MEAAVAALKTFDEDPVAIEPEGWGRTNFGGHYRRRDAPCYSAEEEYEAS